ncbi:TraM recognition domain-containing protein [Enterococcus hirae]|uniref:TraM recognition domain-containing protein n=1 Tax=Enterococcus hirae TaxID=1354 RepID=UPI002DBDE163|nr:TraM recognition domain-containing protein [Enterococcus hirae]EMF0385565.1 TraM recognition domain-containing protein [Enterococcus hirae]EMF0406338.1 TraM recognition domain-containing protein [Enterococcus hirae]EMF0514667.1 TraM recognition domain-containing protein [Enterococcus hirae]MEB7518766.1 TraG/TraD/VirD4 family protein [Enterococcus hirae]
MMKQPNSNNIFERTLSTKKVEEKKMSRYQQLMLIGVLFGVLLYPFLIAGIVPLAVVFFIDKKDKQDHVYDFDYESFLQRRSSLFLLSALLLTVLNLFLFVSVIPRGYLSCYLLFPLNLLHTTLRFGFSTIGALIVGGLGMGCWLIYSASFVEKRKVISKEERQQEILNSKEYKERLKNKHEESQKYTEEYQREYALAIVIKDVALRNKRLEELSKVLLLGTDEYGLSYVMAFKELNQHAILPATTGSGKTTLIQVFIEHAAKFSIPVIVIDGKGAFDTLKAVREIAEAYDRPFRAFVDHGDMRYNPVKNGNDVAVRDKLIGLAETESVYYSTAAKSLLMVTIQLLDEFKKTHPIERSLPFIQEYFLPRNVLKLFADRILEKNPKLFEMEVEVKAEKKTKGKDEKNNEENHNEFDLMMEEQEDSLEVEVITLNPDTLHLLDFYYLIKQNRRYMSKKEQDIFNRLFVRYEHKKDPFYLYVTSENLQNNINMLLDSELGELFQTMGATDELDIKEVVNQNEILYISLDGLLYSEYISVLAQMIVGDINFFCSEVYKKAKEQQEIKDVLVIFDEPSSYLNDDFISLVNKGRGAGIHAIFSPQTMADIDRINIHLKNQLVGNVNTFFIGKTNAPNEIEFLGNVMGTYSDIDVTDVVTQEAGFSDASKLSWEGDKGTKRQVDRFKINPNRIRDLRQGEFVVYRTALNVREIPRVVYIRKPKVKE